MKVVLTFSWLGEDGGFQGKSQGRCSRSGDGRDRAGGPCVLLQPHYIGCHCEADTVGRSNPAPTSTGRLPRTLRVLAMTGARSTFMPPWASHFDRPVLRHVEGVSAQPEPCRRARRTRMRGSAPKVPRHLNPLPQNGGEESPIGPLAPPQGERVRVRGCDGLSCPGAYCRLSL